jgi:hypothetical protein
VMKPMSPFLFWSLIFLKQRGSREFLFMMGIGEDRMRWCPCLYRPVRRGLGR